MRLVEERSYLKGKVEALEKVRRESKQNEKIDMEDITIKKAKSYAIVIKSKNEKEDVKQVKEKSLKVDVVARVQAVRQTRTGKVLVETKTELEREKLKTMIKQKDKDLEIENAQRRGPGLMIYDVPIGLDDEKLKKEMYKKNYGQAMDGRRGI